ncbi:MAG: hypothetical protein ACKVWV_18905 [Planctomycetota bacterium]
MNEPAARLPITDPARRRELAGWIVSALGMAMMVWGVLHMTSQALGTSVRHGFSERRTYNETKAATHAAIPGMLWRASAGLLLLVAGSRLRASQRADAPRS